MREFKKKNETVHFPNDKLSNVFLLLLKVPNFKLNEDRVREAEKCEVKKKVKEKRQKRKMR